MRTSDCETDASRLRRAGRPPRIRAILTRQLGYEIDRSASRVDDNLPTLARGAGDAAQVVHPLIGGDRQRAAERVRDENQQFSVSRFDRIGLLFDPDREDDATWRAWLKDKVLSGFEVVDTPVVWSVTGNRIPFVPIPWDAGERFDDLDESRNLERVAIEIAKRGAPETTRLVESLLDAVRSSGRKVTWKTAFRLLHALEMPESDAGIIDHVFGQSEALRVAVEQILVGSRLLDRLRALVAS